MLNYLLNKFGLYIYKPVIDLVDKKQFNKLNQIKNIDDFVIIENIYLIIYNNKILKNFYNSLNIKYKNIVINNLKIF